MISADKALPRRMVTSIVLALCLCAAGAAFAQTTPAQNAPAQGNNVQGTVASIDSTKNTFVVTPRSGDSTTVQTSDKTKITKSTNVGLAGLKVGDLITVNGQVDTTALTVAARRITVRAAAANRPAGGGQGAGAGNGRSIRGSVATTTPKLTVTGEDGKTYTVNPASDNIQVLAPAPGTFSDITAGANVRVRGSADASGTVTAELVEIRPAGGRRGGGAAGGGQQGAAQ
jgi:hypothetical protein